MRDRNPLTQAPTEPFWREVVAIQGSVTPRVVRRVLIFGAIALVIWIADALIPHVKFHIAVAPYEVGGAVLGLLLVLRTNAGYDRWWEARKLWGGIVNQSRNLAISCLVYGPSDGDWKQRAVRWTAAFSHAARRSLRGEREVPEIAALVGEDGAARVAGAEHMPSQVALELGRLLHEATTCLGLSHFAFLQIDKERAQLIDHIGACERILRTPIPKAYSIKIRRFVFLFLVTLPFALLERVGWLTPLITMLIAYATLSLDEIGVELQNPFAVHRVSHLPLGEICDAIEKNLLALGRNEESPVIRKASA